MFIFVLHFHSSHKLCELTSHVCLSYFPLNIPISMDSLPLRDRVVVGFQGTPAVNPACCVWARPSQYKSWSPESMKQAIKAVVEHGMNVRSAAELYNVPKSTLGDRLSGRVLPGATSGPSSYLTSEEEWELVTLLCRTAAIGYGWCRKEVIAIVERILSSHGVE